MSFPTPSIIDTRRHQMFPVLDPMDIERVRPVSNRSELKDYRDMLAAIRQNVAMFKKQGRSLEEAVAAKPTAAYDAKWGQFVIDPAFFTKLVYEGNSRASLNRTTEIAVHLNGSEDSR
jgi:hypothetical protein